MLSLKSSRPLAPVAGVERAGGRSKSIRRVVDARPVAIVCAGLRNSGQRAGRPARLATSCDAVSAASEQPASHALPNSDLLANVSRIIEIAVLPVGLIVLWRAASLPIEALLFAAYWGLQIAMPVPLLCKLGLGINTSLAVSTALVGAMWTAITRCLLPAKDLMPLSVKADFSFTIPKIVWERISTSVWTSSPHIPTVPFRLMTAPQRLVVLLPVLLSGTMIAALLFVQKKFQARSKTSVVAEPICEQAEEDPPLSPMAALPPVSGWPLLSGFGGGVGWVGSCIRPDLPAVSAPEAPEDRPETPAAEHEASSGVAESLAPEAGECEESLPLTRLEQKRDLTPWKEGGTKELAVAADKPHGPSRKQDSTGDLEGGTKEVASEGDKPLKPCKKEDFTDEVKIVVHPVIAEERDSTRELRSLTKTESPDLVEALLQMSQRVAVLEKQALQNKEVDWEGMEGRIYQLEEGLTYNQSLVRDSITELQDDVSAGAKKTEGQLWSLESQIGSSACDLDARIDEVESSLRRVVDQSRVYLDDLESSQHRTANSLRDVAEDLELIKEQVQEVRDKDGDVDERMGELEDGHNEMMNKLDALADQNEELRINNQTIKEALEEVQETNSNGMEQLEERMERLEVGEKPSVEMMEKVEALQLEVATLLSDQGDIEERLDNEAFLEDYVTKQELEDRLEMVEDREQLTERVSDLQTDVECLRDDLDSLEDFPLPISHPDYRLDGELPDSRVTASELKEMKRDMLEGKESVVASIKSLESDMDSLKDMQVALEARLDEGPPLDEVEDRLDMLETKEDPLKKIETLKEDFEILKDSQERLSARVGDGDDELVHEGELQEVEARLEKLESQGIKGLWKKVEGLEESEEFVKSKQASLDERMRYLEEPPLDSPRISYEQWKALATTYAPTVRIPGDGDKVATQAGDGNIGSDVGSIRKLNSTNAANYPDLVRMWDSELNDKQPEDFTAASHSLAWLRCQGHPDDGNGHPVYQWQARIQDFTRLGMGCPVCAEQRAKSAPLPSLEPSDQVDEGKDADSFGVDVDILDSGVEKVDAGAATGAGLQGLSAKAPKAAGKEAPLVDAAATLKPAEATSADIFAGATGVPEDLWRTPSDKASSGNPASDFFSVKVEDVEEGPAPPKEAVGSAKEAEDATKGLKERPKWVAVPEEPTSTAAKKAGKVAEEEDSEGEYDVLADYSDDDDSLFSDEEYDNDSDEEDYFVGREEDDDTVG